MDKVPAQTIDISRMYFDLSNGQSIFHTVIMDKTTTVKPEKTQPMAPNPKATTQSLV